MKAPGSDNDPNLNAVWRRVERVVQRHITDLNTGPHFVDLVKEHYLPVFLDLAAGAGEHVPIIGVSGAPGTGKTTFARLAKLILEFGLNLRVAAFSIDDFYLDRAARSRLAHQIHPLLATRGVPGTHDIDHLQIIISRLRAARDHQMIRIPAFDKAGDEPVPQTQQPQFQGRPDLILFEGWCIGATPQSAADLHAPVNSLERDQDPDGVWRHHVNHALMGYQAVFKRLDRLIYFQAPNFECVLQWRMDQEMLLRSKTDAPAGLKSPDDVGRFLAHFERIIRQMQRQTPQLADVVFRLDEMHGILTTQ